MNTLIDIRPITTLADMKKAEQVQTETWNMPPDELMSAHSLHALAHNGAALIGAYDGDRLIGLVLGTLATLPPQRSGQPAAERLKMYSVMAGVLPAYQGQGIGRRLKLAQRDFALGIGIDLITWTYDPLESRNGRLNITLLGATCNTYLRHFHGDMGGINAGLPTDRFDIDWYVSSERVRRRAEGGKRPLSRPDALNKGAHLINPAEFTEAGLPAPPESPQMTFVGQSALLAEIPANFQAVKQADFGLARAWRLTTRTLFETLFARQYTVTDFIYERDENGRSRSFYLLEMMNDEG